MAKLNLSSLLEAFALGAGVPQSVLRAVPVRKVPVGPAEARTKDVILKFHVEELNAPSQSHSEGGNLDE